MSKNKTTFIVIIVLVALLGGSIAINLRTSSKNKVYENYLNRELHTTLYHIGKGTEGGKDLLETIIDKKSITQRESELLRYEYNNFYEGYRSLVDLKADLKKDLELQGYRDNVFYRLDVFLYNYNYYNFKEGEEKTIPLKEDDLNVFAMIRNVMGDISKATKENIRKYTILEIDYVPQENNEYQLKNYFKEGFTQIPESWTKDEKVTSDNWANLLVDLNKINIDKDYRLFFSNQLENVAIDWDSKGEAHKWRGRILIIEESEQGPNYSKVIWDGGSFTVTDSQLNKYDLKVGDFVEMTSKHTLEGIRILNVEKLDYRVLEGEITKILGKEDGAILLIKPTQSQDTDKAIERIVIGEETRFHRTILEALKEGDNIEVKGEVKGESLYAESLTAIDK